MNDPYSKHPSQATLRAFSDGLPVDQDLQLLETHITNCDACASALAELQAQSNFDRRLRSAFANHTTATSRILDDSINLNELGPYLQASMKAGCLGRLGHFEIISIVGRGGFGIVLKAFDETLHRIVALKVLAPQLAAQIPSRMRFLREARAAAAVCHEN